MKFRDDLLNFVSKIYGLPSCSLSKVIGLKGSSIHWQILTQSDKFLLKEKPFFILGSEFDFHLHLHHYVQQQRGPVAPLIPTINGKLMFSWRGREFELQKWIDGQHLSPLKAIDMRRLGRLICQFDKAALGFDSPHIKDWNFPRFRWSYFPDIGRKGWKKHLRCIAQALQKAGQANRLKIKWITEWLDKHLNLKAWHSLPQQFIHGDAESSNSVKQESGHCVLVDLDDSRWGYRLTDISWGAAVSAGMEYSEDSREEFPVRMNACLQCDRIEELLKGFGTEVPLTPEEDLVFDDFLGLNLVRAFFGCLFVSGQIKLPKDLDTEIDSLIEMLRSLE